MYLTFHSRLCARLKIILELLGIPFVVRTELESWWRWWKVFRCLDPHHHHSYCGVYVLVAVHEPDAGVVTDETDDGVAAIRHSDRVLDDRIDAIERWRPVYNIIQPSQEFR